jgi:hypothetical protein
MVLKFCFELFYLAILAASFVPNGTNYRLRTLFSADILPIMGQRAY